MDVERVYLELMELTGLARETSAIVKRLEADIPTLYRHHSSLQDRVKTLEDARLLASGHASGRRWVYARALVVIGAVSGTVTALFNWLF